MFKTNWIFWTLGSLALLITACDVATDGSFIDDSEAADSESVADTNGNIGTDGNDGTNADADTDVDTDTDSDSDSDSDTDADTDSDTDTDTDTDIIPICTDIAPDELYTCAEQAGWGKCGEDWMAGFCNETCDRCAPIPDSDTHPLDTDNPVPDCGQEPADSAANSQAKNLLCYLKTNEFISGQTDLGDADWVENNTGRYPAIVAFDFYNYTDGDTSETQKAIDFFQDQNGIVAFQWHWKCPRGGEFYGDCDFVGDLDNPDSKLYDDIDTVARELKKMGDAGVPVMFRPLHESNNNFMWWAKKGQDAYKRLWNLIFERTTQIAGAHNIVWVFNGMCRDQNTSLASWYPGDDKVDVISSDYYQEWQDLDILEAISGNKVYGVAETMNQLDPANDAPFSFGIVWASRDWNNNSENDWKTAMNNPDTISIDQLPDMSQW